MGEHTRAGPAAFPAEQASVGRWESCRPGILFSNISLVLWCLKPSNTSTVPALAEGCHSLEISESHRLNVLPLVKIALNCSKHLPQPSLTCSCSKLSRTLQSTGHSRLTGTCLLGFEDCHYPGSHHTIDPELCTV